MLSHQDDISTSSPTPSTAPMSLKQSNPYLSQVAKMSGLGIIIFNKNQTMEHFNKRASVVFEIELGDFNNDFSFENFTKVLAVSGAFGEQDAQASIAYVHDTLQNRLTASEDNIAEITIFTKSGKRVLLRQIVSDGKIIITAKDITKWHINQQVVEAALASGQAGYWYYDLKADKVEIVSEYFDNTLTQRQMRRAREKGVLAILHPDDKAAAQAIWEKALQTGEPWKFTCRVLKGDGDSIWVRWNATPRLAKNKRVIGFTCFFKDVTRELQTSDALRRAKDTAEKSLKIKNDFLGRLAHEIRTPMNGVIGIADAILHHNSDPVLTPKLELIQSSADKIMHIVDETLNHTKLHADKLVLESKPASPAKSVSSIMQLWEHKAIKSNVDLSYHIDPSVPEEISFDQFRYEQCLNNLLSNALKFTPNGAVKVILTSMENKSGGNQLILAVKDNGIGMTEEQQRQIFEAYTQADKSISRRFGGTGLGMTITKEIIEKMGGAITVRSKLGQGTVFALTLPYSTEQERLENPKQDTANLVEHMLEQAKPEPSNYSELRILVVDDNSTNHMVVNSLISSLVKEVHTANNGQEAIDILKTTEIDIVLMDIHMPVMDGIESTLFIRGAGETWSDVLIIALTADPQYQQKRLCKNIGMDEALAKPVKLSDLLSTFDSVLKIDRQQANAA